MPAAYLAEIAALKARLTEGDPDPGTIDLKLGTLYHRAGESDQALVHLTAARKAFEQKQDRRVLGQVDALTGATCAMKGEHERAATYFERARDVAQRLGDADLVARVALHVADAAASRGESDRARAEWEIARRHFEKYWDGAELSRVYGGLAVLAADAGTFDEADRLSEKALEDAEAAGDPLMLGRALLARAKVRSKAKDLRGAKRFFRRGISVLQDHELRRDLAEAYLAYGLFVGEAAVGIEGTEVPDGFTDPPAFWLAKAQALFRELGGLADLERVREAFRRHGRRATDKIAEVEVLQLLQELKQNRIEVQRDTQRLADHALSSFDKLAAHAPAGSGALLAEIEQARMEIARAERSMARGVDQMAFAEERFLGALNTVILERENIRTLLDLCRALNEIRDYARLPADIAKMAAQLTGADRALVALLDEGGKIVVRGSVRIQDEDSAMWREAVQAAVGKNGSPRLLTTRPQASSGPQRDVSSRAAEQAAKNEQMRLGFGMACPLRHGEKIFGAIYCDKELCGGVFAERDLDLLMIFAAQVATILENSRVAEELRLAARTRAATLEAISDGVLSFAASGAVTSINATAARILGVSAADPQLRLASFPELSFLGGMLARGEEVDGRVTRLGTGDHLLNARCVRADGGAVVGLVVTLTEMKRATSLAQKIVGSTARFTFGDIIGNAPLLRRRLQPAEAAARTDSSVLVTGESGTGKELLAQAIHNAGLRASGPFVGINCAAIPRELLESELFGYEAGAFTGAKRGGHPGKFELAEGGTILLDEIGDMPLEMQAKLLRVLQEKRVQRLGGTKEIPLDTRVIATTNRDLAEECDRGRFRQDLFFRLRVIHIELPPLRSRLDDIPMLTEHFLQLFSARLGKAVRGVAPPILRVLLDYPWPGNIRELEHVLEGEVNLAADGQELLTEVPVMIESGTRRPRIPSSPGAGDSLPGFAAAATPPTGSAVSFAESEKQLLLAALAQHRGSVPDVARALGVSRGTVYNKMKKFQIDPDSYRNE